MIMSRIFSSAEPGPQLTWTAMITFVTFGLPSFARARIGRETQAKLYGTKQLTGLLSFPRLLLKFPERLTFVNKNFSPACACAARTLRAF
jgi:hypothetical protein